MKTLIEYQSDSLSHEFHEPFSLPQADSDMSFTIARGVTAEHNPTADFEQ